MNLAIRKLILLEKDLDQREQEAKISGYSSIPIDREFKAKISRVIDQIRYL